MKTQQNLSLDPDKNKEHIRSNTNIKNTDIRKIVLTGLVATTGLTSVIGCENSEEQTPKKEKSNWDIFLEAKRAEQNEDFEKAIKYYEKSGWFIDALELASKTNASPQITQRLASKIMEIREKQGLFSEAIDYAYHAGLFEKADELKLKNFEKEENFYELANLYEKQGNIEKVKEFTEKAIDHFEKEENFYELANLYEKQGNIEKAIENYEKTGLKKHYGFLPIQKAYTLAEEKGMVEKVKELTEILIDHFEKHENFYELANLYEKQGNIEKAIENYEKTGLKKHYGFLPIQKAYTLAEENGMTEKAKELKEKAISQLEEREYFKTAITLANELGLTEKANNLTEKATNVLKEQRKFLEIGAIYEANNNIEKAIYWHVKTNRFDKVANLYEKQGNIDKAIDSLKRYKSLNEDFDLDWCTKKINELKEKLE